jgi:hypothetical protein
MDKAEIKSFVVSTLSDLGFPVSFFEQIHIVTDEGSTVVGLNQNSLRCMSHILNTIAKHIVKPYSKRVTYSENDKSYAKIFESLLSDITNFLGKAR